MVTALTISWCWEHPHPPEPTPEAPPAPELPVAGQLVHLLFDRLRDFPDAYRAMQETVRQWRQHRRQPRE